MGKVGEYNIKDIETRNFYDTVRDIINFGKYQKPFITSLPDWTGGVGETVIYRPDSGGTTQYIYLGTAWVSTWSITI